MMQCKRCAAGFERKYNHQVFCSDACRFWDKVDRQGDDECWLWLGTKPAFGHGQFRLNGRAVYAHRYVWEMQSGFLAAESCVLHKCDVPACVNPRHLFIGSREENLADMRRKGRGSNPPRLVGSKHHQAKLTESSVRAIRQSAETPLQLAQRYGVARRTIYHVLGGDHWRDTDG